MGATKVILVLAGRDELKYGDSKRKSNGSEEAQLGFEGGDGPSIPEYSHVDGCYYIAVSVYQVTH